MNSFAVHQAYTKGSMEGLLFKWTNYVSGWQQRYFTLKDGILSYYRSEEEVNSGCKGSVKLSVCDVVVHSSDHRRFDLILGEQRFYLRALSQADRQRWVVALGSCKVNTTNEASDETHFLESQADLIANYQSELRLYHSLLVQQVKVLQSTLKEDSIPDMKRVNDVTGTVNAACSTFLTTLDELLSLCHANPLGQRRFLQSSKNERGLSSNSNASLMTSAPLIDRKLVLQSRLGALSRPLSPFFTRTLVNYSSTKNGEVYSWFPNDAPHSIPSDAVFATSLVQASHRRLQRSNRKYKTFFSTMNFSFEDLRPNISMAAHSVESTKLPGDYLSALDFTKACRNLFRIFDRFAYPPAGSTTVSMDEESAAGNTGASEYSFTALQQVQTNVQNNIERLELAAYECTKEPCEANQQQPKTQSTFSSIDEPVVTSPEQVTIGFLVRRDLANGTTNDSGSVYLAILWLARSLNFVREFLHLLFTLPSPLLSAAENKSNMSAADFLLRPSDDSLGVVATEAYSRCLRSFHQWSLRGVAMIVIKSLPSRSHFLHTLLMDNLDPSSSATSDPLKTMEHANLVAQPELYAQLKEDSRLYSDALGRTLTLIEGLLACLDLERVFTGSETY